MRCLLCSKISIFFICKKCQIDYLTPQIEIKYINDNVIVTFFDYDDIEPLIKFKYSVVGSFVFNIIGREVISDFFKNFNIDKNATVVPIDDKGKNLFSATAILARYAKSDNLGVKYGVLRSQNGIKYAGQSREFRINNKKDFIFKSTKVEDIILIDDVITTGETIKQAIEVVEKNGAKVILSVVLADANRGNKWNNALNL